MKTGKIKFFNHSKGYGFIRDNESEKEYFVHVTALDNQDVEIKEDDEVTFDVTETSRGLNAINVRIK